MRTFKLEEYLTKYEFTAPYLLCCSDAETWSMQEILQLANPTSKEMWDSLSLSYTETYGHPKLREQIAQSLYPGLKAENILCFAGAEEGVYAALNVICEPGDHVIAMTPCYQSLVEVPKSRGSDVTEIVLKEENGWHIDLQEIRGAIKTNTKCIVINFPHNPTGAVMTQAELERLVELCRKHDVWLFSDEVYRLLGQPSEGWSSPASCVYEKALSLSVVSKAFGMAGLRVGWISCQDKELLDKIKEFKDYLSICNSAPAEILSLIALENMDHILTRNNNIVSNNITLLDKFFVKHADRFSWVKPEGGCVGFVNYHSSENVDELCARTIKEKGVLLMPASIYDHDSNHFRIGFGRKNIPEALELFEEYIQE